MNLFSLYLLAKKHENGQGKHILVPVYELHNTAEGSEFLDDAIRMKDQPLIYTEEDVVTECSGEPT